MTGIPNVLTHWMCLFKVRVFMELFTHQIQLDVGCISPWEHFDVKSVLLSILHWYLLTSRYKCTSHTKRAEKRGLSLNIHWVHPVPGRAHYSSKANLSGQRGPESITRVSSSIPLQVGSKLMLPVPIEGYSPVLHSLWGKHGCRSWTWPSKQNFRHAL